MSELPPYLIPCSMKLIELTKLFQMITNPEFSAIKIRVGPNIDTNLSQPISKKSVPINLEISRCIDMPLFFGELIKALNQESSISSHGERKG